MINSNVDNFLAQIARQTAPMQKKFKEKSNVEKISLAFTGNWGRYQVLPINYSVLDYPFVTLWNTREICIPRRMVQEDGTEVVNYLWVKILPKNGYMMKDQTGRATSSLTNDEDRLLSDVQSAFDILFDEVGAREKLDIQRSFIRKRNYTIFHAWCANKWNFDETRTPARQNFAGLFICTSRGFVKCIEDNINESVVMAGGDNSWLGQIYNDEMTRTGFMLFSITENAGKPGYNITVNHKADVQPITINLTKEELESMRDPVANLLGWQANKDEETPVGQRRLFNSALMTEVNNFISQQIATVRNAKATGMDVSEAIKKTSEALGKTAPIFGKRPTNDPILQAQNQEAAPQVNPQVIAEKNTQPYQTPPAGHFNPISGAPVNNNPAPQANPGFGSGSFDGGFKKPDFANFGNDNSGLPF